MPSSSFIIQTTNTMAGVYSARWRGKAKVLFCSGLNKNSDSITSENYITYSIIKGIQYIDIHDIIVPDGLRLCLNSLATMASTYRALGMNEWYNQPQETEL